MSYSALQEALDIVEGSRMDSYGSPLENLTDIGVMWGAILDVKITPQQVALCQVIVKVVRENRKPGRDNLVDIAGYARVIELVDQEIERNKIGVTQT